MAQQEYYTILTAAGLAYEASRKAAGLPIKLTQMSVGDGNGAVYNPDATQTALRREVWRGPINALLQDAKNPSYLVGELSLPADVGGWYVREVGFWTDSGVLYAVGKYPESLKPLLAGGAGKEFYIRAIFETSNAESVTLVVDDTVVKATRAFVIDYVAAELAKLDRKNSVRAATTAPIVLSGAQSVDGVAVVEGDRVLVKNQVNGSQNGIYIAANGAWSRAPDADASVEVTAGLVVSVEQGVSQADTIWQLVTDNPIILGSTALAFRDITDGFARLLSPSFTGSPSAPTPAQFDSGTSLATTAFVQRALGNFKGEAVYSADTVLTADAFGRVVILAGSTTGNRTFTLPSASLGVPGARILLWNNSAYTLTVVPAAGNALDTGTSLPTSIVLGAGSSLDVLCLPNSLYRVIGGTANLKASSEFAASLGANGYRRTPSGDIEQWGLVVAAPSGSNTVITLPTAYTVGVHHVGATFANFTNDEAVGSAPVMQARASSLGTITVRNLHTGPASFFWTTKGK